MTEKYKSLLNLPHHTSSERARMSREARAAQFAPFAALTGFEELVVETARVTESMSELTEDRKAEIDCDIRRFISTGESAEILYFSFDTKKSGGRYLLTVGKILRFDEYRREIVLYDGRRIAIDTVNDVRPYKEN